jgi:rRNA processing protein Gar1
MKKVCFLFTILFTCLVYGQTKDNPLVILDSKSIGYIDQAENTLKHINQNDMLIFIYKGNAEEVEQKFGSKSGVIIYATKKYILNTFYQNNIENSPLKKDIPTKDHLSKIGIIGSIAGNINQPYDELVNYISITPNNETVKKIVSITFIKPTDAQIINPDWKFGAIEIMSTSDN